MNICLVYMWTQIGDIQYLRNASAITITKISFEFQSLLGPICEDRIKTLTIEYTDCDFIQWSFFSRYALLAQSHIAIDNLSYDQSIQVVNYSGFQYCFILSVQLCISDTVTYRSYIVAKQRWYDMKEYWEDDQVRGPKHKIFSNHG